MHGTNVEKKIIIIYPSAELTHDSCIDHGHDGWCLYHAYCWQDKLDQSFRCGNGLQRYCCCRRQRVQKRVHWLGFIWSGSGAVNVCWSTIVGMDFFIFFFNVLMPSSHPEEGHGFTSIRTIFWGWWPLALKSDKISSICILLRMNSKEKGSVLQEERHFKADASMA